MTQLVLSVSEFVAVLNQTLEFAYPSINIVGELANLRVNKNRWLRFDLKDNESVVSFFGTVYNMPGPLEDGMRLQVKAVPRLHSKYGFSMNTQQITLVGEGSIKKAASLLEAKLEKEGLFDETRKRILPYPPKSIGLITSSESAAYADFTKILGNRWGGIDIGLADVQVQGGSAVEQIISAVNHFNQSSSPPEIIVVTRGGGSPEDLQAFNSEALVRAVASSRVPTLVAIGHEIDISLAERVADQRASTPSSAAESLVPDKKTELMRVNSSGKQLKNKLINYINTQKEYVATTRGQLNSSMLHIFSTEKNRLKSQAEILLALSPNEALKRGYAIINHNGAIVNSKSKLSSGDKITVLLFSQKLYAKISKVYKRSQ